MGAWWFIHYTIHLFLYMFDIFSYKILKYESIQSNPCHSNTTVENFQRDKNFKLRYIWNILVTT